MRIAQENRWPHISGLAPQTAKLIEYFRQHATPGTEFTYAQLSELIGRDVRSGAGGGGAGNLSSAKRYVLRHDGIRIESAGHGSARLRVLNDTETLISVDRDRKHIHRTANKASLKMQHVNLETLAPHDKTEALTLRAQLGILGNRASAAAKKQIASATDIEALRDRQLKMLRKM
jgi:hypothetical protein